MAGFDRPEQPRHQRGGHDKDQRACPEIESAPRPARCIASFRAGREPGRSPRPSTRRWRPRRRRTRRARARRRCRRCRAAPPTASPRRCANCRARAARRRTAAPPPRRTRARRQMSSRIRARRPRRSIARRPPASSTRMPNSTIAAASLSRLSPSRSRFRRGGAPSSRKIAMTAAGSVVATIAPSSRPTVSGTPASDRPNPIAAAAAKTARIASVRIGPTSRAISRRSIVSAAWNSSSGRKTVRNTGALIGRSASGPAMSSTGVEPRMMTRKDDTPPTSTPTQASSTVNGTCRRAAKG